LRCVAPLDLAIGRVRRRSGTDPSDATEDVTRAVSTSVDAWAAATAIDTSGEAATAVAGALAAVAGDFRPQEVTPYGRTMRDRGDVPCPDS